MSGLNNLHSRLHYIGEDPLSRIRNDKLRSLNKAIENSYQSAVIQTANGTEYSCLINPDKIKPDYDNKMISISTDAGLQPGDTFYWAANATHWIIYLAELTETAYFRAYIRRCRYSIDVNGTEYYVYIQGPTETDIKWYQKSGMVWNQPNLSLHMYVKNDVATLAFLERFQTLELEGRMWRVEATDSISMGGIIEVSLGEYFNNPLAEYETIPVVTPIDTTVPHIYGETLVKPYDIETYTVVDASGGTWFINNMTAAITSSTDASATVEVISGKSGSFTISYVRLNETDLTLNVTIESL
jgi:hypothetical protein